MQKIVYLGGGWTDNSPSYKLTRGKAYKFSEIEGKDFYSLKDDKGNPITMAVGFFDTVVGKSSSLTKEEKIAKLQKEIDKLLLVGV